MAYINLRTGEQIWKADGTTPLSPAGISANAASNLAVLFNRRQRHDYVWANAAGRAAETGMVEGARGYQADMKSEYIFDSGVWRRQLACVTFTAGPQTWAAGEYKPQTGWSVDTPQTTDATVATVTGGVFTITRAGIYLISARTEFVLSGGPDALQVVSRDPAHAQFLSVENYPGNVSTATFPLSVLADGTPVYLWAFNPAAGSLENRTVQITRLG